VGDFDLDTRLDGRDGRYRASLSKDWEIWGPNGGYLAAIALRAAGREARIPRPAAASFHFLSVARFDEVEVAVAPLRMGRSAESLRVSIAQGGRAVLEGMVRTAAACDGLEHDATSPPAVPGPERLKTADELRDPDSDYVPHPFWQNLEARPLSPERFREGPRRRDPVWREWYRFRPRATFDDPWVDAGRLLLLIDTLSWPAAVQAHPDPAYQAPNLEVAAWFHRSAPESEFLLVDTECPVAEAGLMGTAARVWSRDGRLLASGGAQLLCRAVPPPSR
jgi:acyl-CoA thioesterase II